MNYPLFSRSLAGLLLLCTAAFTASAQKINEQELKIGVDRISNSTQHLKNLEPVTFKYDVSRYGHLKFPAGAQYGFMAGNVASEFPAMVYEASKSYQAGKNNLKVARYNEVQTAQLIPVLVAAIKEQQTEIELLKQEVKQLKQKSR